jgi:hypothetical protein
MASRSGGDLDIADCSKCKKMTSSERRQHLGCGYEPPIDRVRLTLWHPPSGPKGYSGPEPTMCAGYTATLPEVIETSILRAHWEKGSLRDACGGEQPTEESLALVLILSGAYNSLQRWLMTPAKDGGGGA